MNRSTINYIICFAILLVIIAIPSVNVPMQSDDYSYMFKGLSPHLHYVQYIEWSGRVVADYISPLLLSTMPHFAYSIVNAAAFSALIILIAYIPVARFGFTTSKAISLSILLIFMIYWVANPNLGQTSFWIVGSANYMWTNMLIALSLSLIFFCIRNQKNRYVLLFISTLIAGCTNENTSLVFVAIVVFICIYEKPGKLFSMSVISGSVIGAAIILLAPGNMKRASFFGEWQNLSFAQKVFYHFTERFPPAMADYWQLYIVAFSVLICICLSGAYNKRNFIFSLVFLIAAILANAAFVLSPGMPPRAFNGSLCFLLISLSFLLYDLSHSINKLSVAIMSLTSAFILFYFVPSYILFNDAMRQAMKQYEIRERLIITARDSGIQNVKIPEFYFTTLVKDSDKFDTFQSIDLAKYYKVSSIEGYNPGFNYAQIDGDWKGFRKPFFDGANLTGIKFYSEGLGMHNVMLIEFDKNVELLKGPSDSLILHFNYKDKSGFLNKDTNLTIKEINGRYFFVMGTNGVNLDKIGSISIGIYDTEKQIEKFSYVLNI
ncbi:TPA: hypothetical protein QHO33_002235 [Citrobacter freundii]|uniref:DUF6056 family protein n=1 Tax=Citrobacter freundii TaxID=546 RepID=UPI0027FFA750|nr:hypothetical protein [Citrobacter freundii]HED2454588.1 hypothetical protein [Citrobacter freundii]